MDIVVDKELLGIYFDSLAPKKKDEKIHSLMLAIETPKNKLKISSHYLEVLEAYFSEKSSAHKSFFQTFVTTLNDEGRLITFTTTIDSDSEIEHLEEIIQYGYQDFTFFLSKQQQLPNLHNHQCVFDQIAKPNKDWFILSLSSCAVVQLDYSDFNTTMSLEDIFKICSKLPTRGKELHIIDSYFNLNGNSQLKYFKANGHKIKCYSSSFKKTENDKSILRNSIKSYFGKKTSVRFSSDKTIIHERKIMIENLILDSTHDFSEITLKNNNWTLYFIICDDRMKKVIEKLKKYN
jgi:hypothetical protein